jgi:segregation and condensation protein B
MTELKKQVEAVLFAAGKAVDIVELSRLCSEPDFSRIMLALEELKQEYEEKQGSLMIVRDGDFWKMVPREQFLSIVRKIVTKTELNKTVVETLATVAAKAPVLQSAIIKIRTNKAYDHLAALEEMGYLSREKKGRSKLIKLTPKFFDYFDVPEGKVREKFARVEELEQQITQKEESMALSKENFQQRKEEHKVSDEEMKKAAEEEGIRLDGEIGQLESELPPQPEEPKIETYVETLGELEVFDEETGQKIKKEAAEKKPAVKIEKKERKPMPQKEKIEAVEAEVEESQAPKEPTEDEKLAEKAFLEKQAASKGVFAEGMTEDVKKRVDEEVEEMTGVNKAAKKSETEAENEKSNKSEFEDDGEEN